MQEINWDKLQSYSDDNKKSFEELCYQIVSEKYQNEIERGAKLTSIDDSGGGDGVEFYITFENGDVYGWQAKFFCRLNEGGRKEQIKKSLQTAYKKHPNIKKWFLCSKCSFTPDEKDWFDNNLANSTKNGERVLPENHSIELIHWGDSELLNFLRDYSSIHKFFFSDKLLTQDWFKDRYETDIKKTVIKAKYESKIHIPTDIDTAINKLLGGQRLAEILEETILDQQVEMYAHEYKDSVRKIFSENVLDEYKEIQEEFKKFLADKENIIQLGIDKLLELKDIILSKDEKILQSKVEEFKEYIRELHDFYQEYKKLTKSDLCKPIEYLREEFEEYKPAAEELKKSRFDKFKGLFKKEEIRKNQPKILTKEESEEINKENKKRSDAKDIFFGALYALEEYAISSLEWCFNVFELLDQNELHIFGDAGMGKTHISFNIYEDQIENQKQPALFIFAKNISSDQSLENQLKDYFGIPTDWSFDDFLGALEVTAKVNKTKIPIIIDGLNESTYWDTIWKNNLENLIIKIKKKPHLALITTYRTSYETQLFPSKYFEHENRWKLKKRLSGFENLTWDAIDTYFEFYKIKLDNRSNAIGYFEHPLHLKIFCETKNPNRDKEIKVSFQNEDLFEVFDEYIKRTNENITSLLEDYDPKYDKGFTQTKLLEFSRYLWENNSRGVPRSENLLSTEELRIFEGENLLVFRDWNHHTNKEEIQFTYDLLGGYFISRYLTETYKEYYPYINISSDNLVTNAIKTGLEFFITERGTKLLESASNSLNKRIGNKNSLLKFTNSKEFKKKLLEQNTQHPLFDDILRTISILLIKQDNIFLFDVLNSERAKKYSTESLFEINERYIKENEELIKEFLSDEFIKNNKNLLNLAQHIELDHNHTLNFNFWSDLLKDMSMVDRDLSWSEYVREKDSWYGKPYFSNLVKQLEKVCRDEKELSNRVHFAAKKIMWVLTTNIRRLRDESTQSLYYYARKYPKEFFDLLKYSLSINDPYVSERMLAVSYGLAMARQNDFEDKSYKEKYLPLYGKFIFDNLFAEDAKYTTTHILARDYAKRTIDLALLHYPDLLEASEKELIKYPLQSYPHMEWGESKDRNDSRYSSPMHMDFKNYTIGRLINDRSNYDSEHNEYQLVLSQIYWRIYDLGYSLEIFGEIDNRIASDNWNSSRHENASKTDRYGKKYSWIAFYEMAGYRSDLGLLKGWDDENEFRISDVDIDPSFPTELKQYNLFEGMTINNFLGQEESSPEDWYDVDSDLDIEEYILLNKNFDNGENHEWILLKGSISQKDQDDQKRDIHISINAVLIDEDDLQKINTITDKYDDYSFEYIRQNEDYYIFEGEIPWCDLTQNNYSQTFKLSYNFHDVKKIRKNLKILNNGIELTDKELAHLKKKETEYLYQSSEESSNGAITVDFDWFTKGKDELTKTIAEDMGYTISYVDTEYSERENDDIKVDVETTILESSWESYHSETNPSGSTKVPSKNICNSFELFLKPQSSDLYTKDGEMISTAFKDGEGYDNTSSFVYIRKDYLERYLISVNKKILWLQWAEKRYFPNGVKQLNFDGIGTEYRNFYKIIF